MVGEYRCQIHPNPNRSLSLALWYRYFRHDEWYAAYHRTIYYRQPDKGIWLQHVIMTFPRFYRHLKKEENDEIGGANDHQDTTVVYGGL
jgi:hypothetical protein